MLIMLELLEENVGNWKEGLWYALGNTLEMVPMFGHVGLLDGLNKLVSKRIETTLRCFGFHYTPGYKSFLDNAKASELANIWNINVLHWSRSIYWT